MLQIQLIPEDIFDGGIVDNKTNTCISTKSQFKGNKILTLDILGHQKAEMTDF